MVNCIRLVWKCDVRVGFKIGIKVQITSRSVLPLSSPQALRREEVFVTSKLWNTKHDPEDVEEACRTTLDHLGLSYLDLYLMHWPIAFQ